MSTDPSEPLVLSYGMGVDSTAVLVGWWQRGIRPHWIGHAQVGNEWPETYAYRPIIDRWLADVGFPTITDVRYIVKRPKHGNYSTLEENCRVNRTLPSLAFGYKKCSLKWKGGPLDAACADYFEEYIAAGRTIQRAIGYDDGSCDSRRGGVETEGPWKWIYPLREWGWDRARCVEEIKAAGLPVPPKSACTFCLGGETEVVTREGVRPINELAGGHHELLVPQRYKLGGLAHRGKFVNVEVRSFGIQPLFEVKLQRGSATRTVRTTAEHRWFVTSKSQWTSIVESTRTTATLQVGDKLRTLRASPPVKEQPMAAAIAQGFTFGDGTRGHGERPASVVFHGAKDRSLIKFFTASVPRMTTVNGRREKLVYGLPRFWKDLPPIRESRAFLLSWLAGYFAADGSVLKSGVAALESASLESLKFARSAAAVCGVGYSRIQKRMRLGKGKTPSALYRFHLRRSDLPKWFFLIKKHRDRALAVKRHRQDDPWKVVAVRALQCREEVFCAVVPGAAAFGLSEDLMTGNCPSTKPAELIQLAKRHPDLARRAIEMEDLARPGLIKIEGLWGKGVKGTRGGEKKPGSWRAFLAEHAPEVLPPLPSELPPLPSELPAVTEVLPPLPSELQPPPELEKKVS